MQNNRMSNIDKDAEDIRVIHRKCIAVISSCENLLQMRSAETYFKLAVCQLRTTYPRNNMYVIHNKVLDKVFNNIDTFLTLKRRQLRMS